MSRRSRRVDVPIAGVRLPPCWAGEHQADEAEHRIELASVLAAIITRLRHDNDGVVPLTTRYDPTEHAVGPPLPHLFQHKSSGWKWEVLTNTTIYKLLDLTLARTELSTADGEPLHYRPHDFRRMVATEAATGGLPVHILARIVGHANINTTQAYLAVFDEALVQTYRAFLDRRRRWS